MPVNETMHCKVNREEWMSVYLWRNFSVCVYFHVVGGSGFIVVEQTFPSVVHLRNLCLVDVVKLGIVCFLFYRESCWNP